jgi:hypothetical protein
MMMGVEPKNLKCCESYPIQKGGDTYAEKKGKEIPKRTLTGDRRGNRKEKAGRNLGLNVWNVTCLISGGLMTAGFYMHMLAHSTSGEGWVENVYDASLGNLGIGLLGIGIATFVVMRFIGAINRGAEERRLFKGEESIGKCESYGTTTKNCVY